tara:strand:+ start:11884 stop:12060 length:177 start_codon:yes stop_codon:yes gene_type:complete
VSLSLHLPVQYAIIAATFYTWTGLPMNTTPLAYQLSGCITAEALPNVSYFGMDEPPHG